MKVPDQNRKRLEKKVRRGFRGHPLATIAYYGPTNELASKVAVGVVLQADAPHAYMQKWVSSDQDVRTDPTVTAEMLAFIQAHGVLSVVMTRGIIGCPHQEGVDYEGEWCPVCEFWRGRDRFTGERIH